MLDEWDKFYADIWPRIMGNVEEFTILSESDFYKSAYFIYFFGSMYKYIVDTSKDEKFVKGCYIYLYQTLKFVDAEPFDYAGLFFKAFP